MTALKKILIAVLVLALAAAGGLLWLTMNYHVVDFTLYAKNAASLDLRGQDITPEHYDALREKLPNARIRWDVPFQGQLLADDTKTISIATLSEADVAVLDYLTSLKTVDARQCTDYAQLEALRQRRPEVAVDYAIRFSAEEYPWDADQVLLTQVEEGDIHLLQYLTGLETVLVGTGQHDVKTVQALQGTAHNLGLEFGVFIGGAPCLDTQTGLTIKEATEEDLALLPHLTQLQQLHLVDPKAQAQSIVNLSQEYPALDVTWEVSFDGQSFREDTEEVDLSKVVIQNLAELEEKMAYLPNLKTLVLGLCGQDNPEWGASKTQDLAICDIPNEDLAAYRDRVRERYKVVWTVRLGPSIALRTDKDNFMPNHFGVGQLFNDYAYNLRYCEDMVCLDVGHMTLTDISFVTFMPKLKYLILAWTEVQYIEPIRTCKNLVWLELDNSCIRDYSPLVDCTALEDLNIGNTFCDITPVLEMTWLKNLYMIDGNGGDAWKASQALPDTHVVATGNATVGGGWRRLPNYYDMRDCLNMYYMN